MPAKFFEHDVKAQLKDRKKLSAFLDALVHRHLEGIKKIRLSYIFCSDEHLLGINKEFLNHDTFTDIVTFDLSEGEHDLVGEMYISTDRVADNANKFGTAYQQELHRVIFHGTLHLCGFMDKKKEDKEEMRRQEDLCLQAYFKD